MSQKVSETLRLISVEFITNLLSLYSSYSFAVQIAIYTVNKHVHTVVSLYDYGYIQSIEFAYIYIYNVYIIVCIKFIFKKPCYHST